MTSRERMRCVLKHEEADRIPIDFGSRSSAIEEEAYEKVKEYLGIKRPTKTFIRAHAALDLEVMELFRIDTRWIRYIPRDSWMREDGDSLFIDRWKVPWRKTAGSLYYQLDSSPLKGLEHSEVLNRQWSLMTDEMLEEMRSQAEGLYHHSDYALFCDIVGAGIFERAWYLRGFEGLMMEIMVEKSFIHHFFEKILEAQITGYEKLFAAVGSYLEGVIITDDLATQDNLIVSPEIYRRMIKPYQRRLIEFIHSKGVKVIPHCCGAIRALLPDFIEMGVQIIHPVQTSARGMDSCSLKLEFGKDLVFGGGGCDTQILQFGSAKEV